METSNQNTFSITSLLRLAGAIALLAAAGSFLLQQWDAMTHLAKYYSFLVSTLVLAGTGFFCGLKLNDDKSARTLLLVIAAIIPVHFAQLGGMLYSVFGKLPYLSCPDIFLWRAPSPFLAIVTTAIGLGTLSVISFITYYTLIRSVASRYMAIYLGMCSLLLIPIRNSEVIGLAALAMLFISFIGDLKWLKKDTAMQTLEGHLCRAMLFTPFVVLTGRNLLLYSTSELFFASLFAGIALVFHSFIPQYLKGAKERSISVVFSILPAFMASALFGEEFCKLLHVSTEYKITFMLLPFTAVLAFYGKTSENEGKTYYSLAGYYSTIVSLYQLYVFPDIYSALLCIVIGLGTAATAYALAHRDLFYLGCAAFLGGIVFHLRFALQVYEYSPTLSLGLLGLGTIVLAAYLEQNGRHLKLKLEQLRERLDENVRVGLEQ